MKHLGDGVMESESVIRQNYEEDLKTIKKYYGEKMSHLCRELFPTLLEKKGLLPSCLLSCFNPTHVLYDDLIKNNLVNEFKTFIYQKLESKERFKQVPETKTVKELFADAGYDLFECKTEEEIQSFKKYYAQGEELCTFNGGRLENYRVFFAVKKNVAEIKRENFSNPARQDEYGTSVISIQFLNNGTNLLSIKNRYNHTVVNCDATFSNNLDNIQLGLADAFERDYGIFQTFKVNTIEIPGYVVAADGKYYKYNYEIDNVYYCPDNIIIDAGKVVKYEKEKYLVLDNFILDLVKKKISTYQNRLIDGFVSALDNILKIDIKKNPDGKTITIKQEGSQEDIIIELDKENKIVGYINNNLIEAGDFFLNYNQELNYLEAKKLKYLGNEFLRKNKKLKIFALPNLEKACDNLLSGDEELEVVLLPRVKNLGNFCFNKSKKLKNIFLHSAQTIGNSCFSKAKDVDMIYMPNVQEINMFFGANNETVNILYAPLLKIVGGSFFAKNKKINTMVMPVPDELGIFFLENNEDFNGQGKFYDYDKAEDYFETVKTFIKRKTNNQ